MQFAYEIQKSIKIQSLGGFFPSLSPLLLPLSDSWMGLHPLSHFNLVISFNLEMDETTMIREYFTRYFVEEGKLPWQLSMIT
jgi:hypothetical protein